MNVSNEFREFLDNERMYCWENEKGLEQLNTVCKQIGYTEQPWRNGTSLEEFLKDNSGCIEAILEWIDKTSEKIPDWKTQLTLEDDPEYDDHMDSMERDVKEELQRKEVE